MRRPGDVESVQISFSIQEEPHWEGEYTWVRCLSISRVSQLETVAIVFPSPGLRSAGGINDGDLQVHDVGVRRAGFEQPARARQERVRVVD